MLIIPVAIPTIIIISVGKFKNAKFIKSTNGINDVNALPIKEPKETPVLDIAETQKAPIFINKDTIERNNHSFTFGITSDIHLLPLICNFSLYP